MSFLGIHHNVFDDAAELYDRVRPGYSDALIEDILSAFFSEISDVIMKMGGKVERLYETLAIAARVQQ